MSPVSARPRPIGTLVLATLILALAALLPAAASAAPEGGEAPLEVSPPSAVLPTTTAGFQSPTQAFSVAVTGGEPVSIDGVGLEGADAGDFWIDWASTDCGGFQEACALGVVFAPNSLGPKSATVRIWVGGYEPKDVPISAEAVAPELTLKPSSIAFGTQWVNDTHQRPVLIENSGAARVSLSGIELKGPDVGRFWNGHTDCWSLPEGWLDPGASCTTDVYFQPDEVRDYEATLAVRVNEDSFAAPLSGRGGRAVMEPDANPVDFGALTAGSSSPIRTVALTNVGDLPGSFFIAVIAGGDTGSFELVEETCSGAPIEPGEGCAVTVRFSPEGAGAKQALLALFGDNDGGTTVALAGVGVAPALALGPTGLDFGAGAVGGRGPARPFTLRNAGSTPVELGGVGIVGGDPDQFLLAGDGCTGVSLGAGGECQVLVRFAPASLGPKAATLRIGAEGGAVTAALVGSGVLVPAPAEDRAATKRAARKRAARMRRIKRRHRSHSRRGKAVSRGRGKARVHAARSAGRPG